MAALRRLLVLAAVMVGAAVLASPLIAARPGLPGDEFQLATPHFVVHYQSDTVDPTTTTWAITQTQAGDIAALAEQAYASELADGYPAPMSDGGLGGNSKIDIYVADLSSLGALGLTMTDTNNPQTSSYIELDGTSPEAAFTQHTIAHELFHVLQVSVWNSPNLSDYWLYEGSAEWMGYRVDHYLADSGGIVIGPDEMSLDCRDAFGTSQCDLTSPYLDGGYSRWPFYEYLSERYGASFTNSIFAQGAGTAPTATDALSQALVAKGTTLSDTYNAWSALQLTGGYTIKTLQDLPLTVSGAPIQTGSTPGALPSTTVTVNHLATRYIEFQRGGGQSDPSQPCFAATLSISVALPAGVQSKPMFYWKATGSSPVGLSVSGNTATGAIPWDTCNWLGSAGYLSLPNASWGATAVDGADFVVSASLSVDTTKPATTSAAPLPVSIWGPVVSAPSSDAPPAITVYGPELLRLSATQRQIRLIVESSGSGTLQAAIGSTALGAGSLRPGNNDLRFTVPASLIASLRRQAATNLLTLTPVSPSGAVTGQPVTRQVAFAAVKAPAKHAVKRAAKSPPKKHK